MHFSLSRKEFRAVYSQSISKPIGDLLFYYSNYSSPRLGLIVSKKYGNAVSRNLFKRRIREIFIHKILQANINMAIIIKPLKKDIKYSAINNSFDKLISLL